MEVGDDTWFGGAQVLNLDDPTVNIPSYWPEGYTLLPDSADPTRGTLIPTKEAEEPKQAGPPSDTTSR